MKKFYATVAMLFAICNVHAESPAFAFRVQDSQEFAVAGVLRKSTEAVVIKLVQSVETARSAEEAIGQFTRKVQRDYAGYSVWDTVVTPLSRPACQTVI